MDTPVRQDEIINGRGFLFDGETNLGEVGYEIRVFIQIPNLLKGDITEGSKEFGGHIAPVNYGDSLGGTFGKDLILKLDDGRHLHVKLGPQGSINESKGFIG